MFQSEVVESFPGVVVVDGPIGGFSGCSQRLLNLFEYGVPFGEGSNMFVPVVSGQLVFRRPVEADTNVAVVFAGGVRDVVFGGEPYLPISFVDTPSFQRGQLFVSVYIESADVGDAINELDFDVSRGSASRMVGFETVESVSSATLLLVGADEADVTRFEQTVQMLASQRAVICVADQTGELVCSPETLVNDRTTFGWTGWRQGVDGEYHLFVPTLSANMGERKRKAGDHCAAASRMQGCVLIVPPKDDLTGVLVNLAGIIAQCLGAGSHNRDIPVADSLDRRTRQGSRSFR